MISHRYLRSQKMNTYFSNIHKGTITLGESPEWNLGNLILKFYEDPDETYVDCLVKKKIFGKERLCSLTHLHIENSEMEAFIKDIDNPDNRIRINNSIFLGYSSFEIVNKEDTGRRGFYSEL